ncbi:hypothetical protein [Georgfuchsia toluolica]
MSRKDIGNYLGMAEETVRGSSVPGTKMPA